MNELNCPARTYGSVAVCRFCIYTGGGPSALCVRMLERYNKERVYQAPNPIVPLSSDLTASPAITD